MSRERIAAALKGHRYDSMSQDSGMHCVCGSDSRFMQVNQITGRQDPPWSEFSEHLADVVIAAADRAPFPLAKRFTVGERICIPGRSGSYPDHSKNQWGYVTAIEPYLPYLMHERLIVTLDGEEPRAINPDVVGHGDDWRWADTDPNKEQT